MLDGDVEGMPTPSASGRGQVIVRCPACRVAVWSHYAGAGEDIHFVRVGTLDEPDTLPPDIHIYTESRQPWVVIPPQATSVPGYYRARDYWPATSITRWQRLRAGTS